MGPPSRTPFFSGRKLEIAQIRGLLQRGNSNVVVNIVGPPGAGKSTLAVEVVEAEKHTHRVAWISCKDYRAAPSEFKYFRHVYLQRDALFGTGNKIIVVLDGLDECGNVAVNDWQRIVFNNKAVAALLVTSRDSVPFPGQSIQVSGLPPHDARELLLKLMTQSRHSLTETEIGVIVGKSGGMPVALGLLSGLFRDCPVDEVLARLSGEIYALDQVQVAKIIQVKPQIITFSGELVRQLKRSPERLHEVNSRQFEQLIADLFNDMGWEVQLTKATRDGGRDILAHLNTGAMKLLCLIEAKKHRPSRPVGVGLVRNLYGTFCDEQANSAMLVTTSHFTAEAIKFQSKHKYQLSLKDYTDVVGWLSKFEEKK